MPKCKLIANNLPITKTLGGYILQTPAAPSTHTLLANPTTHYSSGEPDNSVISDNPNTWIPYSSGITKTIYDPCPYGYRVPINGSWNDNFPSKRWTGYTVNEGHSWKSSWWPAAGYRNRTNAILYDIGTNGNYWSSSPHSIAYYAYNLNFYYNNGVNPSHNNYRSSSFSIRCIEEDERKRSVKKD